jgi:hypothetical protein
MKADDMQRDKESSKQKQAAFSSFCKYIAGI